MEIQLKALEALNHKYFGLAHILIPDEMMATQLLVDASSKHLLGLNGLAMTEGELGERDFVKDLISLAKIRQKHFVSKKRVAFDHLNLDERAILYLKDKKQVENAFIAYVLDRPEENILALIHQARAKFIFLIESENEDVATFEGSVSPRGNS